MTSPLNALTLKRARIVWKWIMWYRMLGMRREFLKNARERKRETDWHRWFVTFCPNSFRVAFVQTHLNRPCILFSNHSFQFSLFNSFQWIRSMSLILKASALCPRSESISQPGVRWNQRCWSSNERLFSFKRRFGSTDLPLHEEFVQSFREIPGDFVWMTIRIIRWIANAFHRKPPLWSYGHNLWPTKLVAIQG